jgi:hypothetical protein
LELRVTTISGEVHRRRGHWRRQRM